MFRRYLNLILTAIIATLTTFVLLFLTVAPLSAQDDDGETEPAAELADPEGQFIIIDDLEIYYIDQGPTDAPTVMLLHGFGGSTFTWRYTTPALLDAGYRVVSYDRPPFGLSAKQSDITMTDTAQAERLASLMDAIDIETAVLVGHSAGGGVIAQFAATYPERVDGLVFAAGAVGGGADADTDAEATSEADSDGSPLGRLFELGAMIDPENPSTRTLIRRLLTPEQFMSILADAYHPDFEVTAEIEAGYARVLRVDNWEVGLLSILTQNEAGDPVDLDALSTLDVPVLLIWGEDDTWVPFERAGFLRMAFPDAKIITFPNTGHMPMEERPERFNNALLAFLDN